jgi:hypothetical protein
MYSPTYLKEFAPPKTAADLRDLLAESIIEIRLGKMESKDRQRTWLPGSELHQGN